MKPSFPLGAEKSVSSTSKSRPFVRLDWKQKEWLKALALQFGLDQSRLVALLASGSLQLPWSRLEAPPPEIPEFAATNNVKLPEDGALRARIGVRVATSGLQSAVFVRRAVFNPTQIPAAADAIMLLPTSEETVLQMLYRLIGLFRPMGGANCGGLPEPLGLRRHVEQHGFGRHPEQLRQRIFKLERRVRTIRRLGGRRAAEARKELRVILAEIQYHESVH
jgi:hypothetical protein